MRLVSCKMLLLWSPVFLSSAVGCSEAAGVQLRPPGDAEQDGQRDVVGEGSFGVDAVVAAPGDTESDDASAHADSGDLGRSDVRGDGARQESQADAQDLDTRGPDVPSGPCEPGTEDVAPTMGSNVPVCVACAAGTYCAGGTVGKVACASGTWDHDQNPATACIAQAACVAGQHLVNEGSSTLSRVCAPCAAGTFSSTVNAPKCLAWKICEAGSYVAADPSLTFDRSCGACPVGAFTVGTNSKSCTRAEVPLVAGSSHSCAIMETGVVKCWGDNVGGQLGLGDTLPRGDDPNEMGAYLPAIEIGGGRAAKSLIAGAWRTCAVLDGGTAKCWGAAAYGSLGLGDTSNRGDAPGEMGSALEAIAFGGSRTASALTAGTNHTCALLDDHTVRCWGWGGILGLGDTIRRGDLPGQMGDSLPVVQLGSGRSVVALAAGSSHTCVLLDNGMIKCWGANDAGQLGLGDTSTRGDDANEMGDALPVVSLGTGRWAVAVTAAYSHTCALLDQGVVKCWGANNYGQLGLEDTNKRGAEPGQMGDALLPVNLGVGRSATAIAAAGSHTCALLDNGAVKCWGANGYGELGLGTTSPRGGRVGQMGDALPALDLGNGSVVKAIAAGQDHNCVLLSDRGIKCWGRNDNGQLGLGDKRHRGDGPDEMGDALPVVLLR